jgi:ABC-2 type transport system permease protein
MASVTTPVTAGPDAGVTTPAGIVPPNRSAGAVATAKATALRTVRKFFRSPQLVVLGTVQGALFLLIFRYVFGGAIDTGPVPYVDFLVPGFVLTGILFQGMNTSAGVAEDLEQGFFDRLRSLPVPRSALLAGRALGDTVALIQGTVVTAAIGFLVGFRLHGSLAEASAPSG